MFCCHNADPGVQNTIPTQSLVFSAADDGDDRPDAEYIMVGAVLKTRSGRARVVIGYD